MIKDGKYPCGCYKGEEYCDDCVYAVISELEKENQQLKLELKAEREGNDFYAAPHRYQRGEVFFKSVLTGDHGDMEIFDDVNNCYYQVSGRMARQVQAKRVLALE